MNSVNSNTSRSAPRANTGSAFLARVTAGLEESSATSARWAPVARVVRAECLSLRTREFVHAAPWSTANQGLANVSHGCVGMSLSNAIWLFNLSTVGDVIKVINSPRTLEPGNGYTDWNVPWKQWRKGSALGADDGTTVSG